MIVSFTGAQSTGKSTLLKLCKGIYKDKFSFVDEVTRYVRDQYGVKINEEGNNITQSLIINQHIINYLQHKDRDVIMDRCIIDGLVYTEWLYLQGKVDSWCVAFADSTFNSLVSNIDIVFYCEPDFTPVDDGVRSINKQFRDDIIQSMEHKLKRPAIKTKVIRLSGSIDNRMNKIKSILG